MVKVMDDDETAGAKGTSKEIAKEFPEVSRAKEKHEMPESTSDESLGRDSSIEDEDDDGGKGEAGEDERLTVDEILQGVLSGEIEQISVRAYNQLCV